MADFYLHPEKIGGDFYLAPVDAPSGTPTVTSVSVTPTSATQTSGTIQFTVTVNGTNSPSQATTAAISGLGSINSANLYTVPAQTSVTQTATITWTSVQDSSKSAGAVVTIPAAGTELVLTYRFISLQRDYNTDTIHFVGLIG